jgi:hypothetical protein
MTRSVIIYLNRLHRMYRSLPESGILILLSPATQRLLPSMQWVWKQIA